MYINFQGGFLQLKDMIVNNSQDLKINRFTVKGKVQENLPLLRKASHSKQCALLLSVLHYIQHYKKHVHFFIK